MIMKARACESLGFLINYATGVANELLTALWGLVGEE